MAVKLSKATWRKLERLIATDAPAVTAVPPRTVGTNIVRIQNSSGADVGQFGVLGISGSVIDPAAAAFAQTIVLTGITPATAHAGGRFVLCAEPIKDGSVGRAYAAGVTVSLIAVSDDAHAFADAADGQSLLASADSGPCSILWKEAGTGEKWAVVRFGGAGGEGGIGGDIIWAKVIASLIVPSPEAEPEAGIGEYVIRLDSDTFQEWSTGVYPADTYRTKDGRLYKSNVETTATWVEGEWDLQDEINPKHVNYGAVDWRWFVPVFDVDEPVLLIKKGSDYYFAQKMLRVRHDWSGNQSIQWNWDHQRVMAVYAAPPEVTP